MSIELLKKIEGISKNNLSLDVMRNIFPLKASLENLHYSMVFLYFFGQDYGYKLEPKIGDNLSTITFKVSILFFTSFSIWSAKRSVSYVITSIFSQYFKLQSQVPPQFQNDRILRKYTCAISGKPILNLVEDPKWKNLL